MNAIDYKKMRSAWQHGLGWAVFLLELVWLYRIPPWMWSSYLPSYGDPLEALWQIDFWRTAILTGSVNLVHLTAAYPLGIHQFSVAHAGIGLLLLPLSVPLGSAVALNIGFLLSLVVSFLGAYFFVRKLCHSDIISYFSACVFTFALGRTVHIYGHLNVLCASALGAWMSALLLHLRKSPSTKLATIVGILWSISIISQPYMIFMGAVLLVLLGSSTNIKTLVIVILTTTLISSPFLLYVLEANNFMSSLSPTIERIVYYNADITSYLGWGPLSYWEPLRQLTKSWIQRDTRLDQNVQTWGVLIVILSIWGSFILIRILRDNYALLGVLLISITLSLGPLLVNPPFAFEPAQQLSRAIWQLGAYLKPSVFRPDSAALATAGWPLPAILPLATVPYFELARIPRRYAIWVGLVAVALSALALSRLPRRVAIFLCCLWLLELLPQPIRPRMIPTEPHPAHRWAAEELAGRNKGIHASDGMVGVYSQHLAGQLPGTGFIGSFVPAHMHYLLPWRRFTEQALTQPDQVAILHRAQVEIVLTNPEQAERAKQNPSLRFIQCFDPGPAKYYFPKILCAFRVLNSGSDFFNIQPVIGFSDFQTDEVYIENGYAKAGWRISQVVTHTLDLDLQMNCLPASVVLRVNGRESASHSSSNSIRQHWRATLYLSPAQLVNGWNTVELMFQKEKSQLCGYSAIVRRLRVIPTD